MKILTDPEVLVVAGGLPPGAALDEATYRTPAEPIRDAMTFADLATGERPEGARD